MLANIGLTKLIAGALISVAIIGTGAAVATQTFDSPSNDQPIPPEFSQSDSLRATVQQSGTAQVIVGLDIGRNFEPEGQLRSRAVRRQRNAIADAQSNIQADLALVGGANVNAQYETIPYIALEVNEAALEHRAFSFSND